MVISYPISACFHGIQTLPKEIKSSSLLDELSTQTKTIMIAVTILAILSALSFFICRHFKASKADPKPADAPNNPVNASLKIPSYEDIVSQAETHYASHLQKKEIIDAIKNKLDSWDYKKNYVKGVTPNIHYTCTDHGWAPEMYRNGMSEKEVEVVSEQFHFLRDVIGLDGSYDK